MKKSTLLVLCFAALAAVSCRKEEKPKPKVIYENKADEQKDVKPDSAQIKVADLPVHMEGTKYLIHPIGDIRVYDDKARSYGSSRTNNVSYAISNYNRYELTGYFENLKFQHIDSTALYPLTDKHVQIQTVTYLNTITKRQVLVYSMVDSDTNKDKKIDLNDIKSLYISDVSGRNFHKLSLDMQELLDWNIVEAQNRLYFRTIEDINQNGAFDEKDKVHYHFVDLLSADWATTDYEPVQ